MNKEPLTLETVLRDARDLGDAELCDMATGVQTRLGVTRDSNDNKAGDNPVTVWPTNWAQGYPGVAL
eukprot:6497119-Heterocapsa_arctica.AAC.1